MRTLIKLLLLLIVCVLVGCQLGRMRPPAVIEKTPDRLDYKPEPLPDLSQNEVNPEALHTANDFALLVNGEERVGHHIYEVVYISEENNSIRFKSKQGENIVLHYQIAAGEKNLGSIGNDEIKMEADIGLVKGTLKENLVLSTGKHLIYAHIHDGEEDGFNIDLPGGITIRSVHENKEQLLESDYHKLYRLNVEVTGSNGGGMLLVGEYLKVQDASGKEIEVHLVESSHHELKDAGKDKLAIEGTPHFLHIVAYQL